MMPAFVAFSTACTSGSVAAGSKIGWPSDRLMMSMPKLMLVGDGEFDRANHVARAAAAGSVEHLQADELHRRRNAFVLDVGGALEAADQAGDVRAVTVIIEGRASRSSCRR